MALAPNYLSTLDYTKTYTSFSGTDIVAAIKLSEDMNPVIVGELQTISYSIHREVVPVRTLSRINPIGFTNGPRTIAGSLIFTVFNRNIVHELVEALAKESDYDMTYESIVMDELPPFDIIITMENEYGNKSCLVIKGIVIVDEGQVMSIEDMITENTYSYMADDIEVLNNTGYYNNFSSSDGSDSFDNGTVTNELGIPGAPSTKILEDGSIQMTFTKGNRAFYTQIEIIKGSYGGTEIDEYTTSDSSIILTNLERGNRYYIKMRSTDQSKDIVSAWTTTEWWFQTPSGPSAPSNFSTTFYDDGLGSIFAVIRYTRGTYSVKEEISYAHGAFGAVSFKNVDDIPDESFLENGYITFGPLTRGDTYFFKMRSVDESNIKSPWTTAPYNFVAPNA